MIDGSDIVEEVAVRELTVEAGINEIDLDMTVPGAGRYLLTRVGDFPLARRDWGGWNSQSREGVTLHGGNKPDRVTLVALPPKGASGEYATWSVKREWADAYDRGQMSAGEFASKLQDSFNRRSPA